MPHALLVDDNTDTLEALTEVLRAEGFTASAAPNLDEAKAALARQTPDVVLLDLNLPDGSGMTLLDGIEGLRAPAVVLITGHASVSTVVEALRRGVTDYLTKPVDVDRLRTILGNIAHTRQLPEEIKSLQTQTERDSSGRFGLLVGRSANMRRTFDLIARIAPSSASVLISGESGTGKDVVARTMHSLSRRRHGPFVPVNCGAISAALLESELFGHERGSFTGADRRHRGYFERAHRGTLFLDEVTEMPLELQVKLLRVIESGTFFRVGAEQPISVDVRILAASNRDVLRAISGGQMREDLYYRLRVFELNVSPLRDRPDDVEPLVRHFLDELAQKEGVRKEITSSALDALTRYTWPGNVRDLRNVIQSAYILADELIDVDSLPEAVTLTRAAAPRADEPSAGVLRIEMGASLADIERRAILATLRHCHGNKNRAAEVLGISLKTLYNRLSEYRTAGHVAAEPVGAVSGSAEATD
jgi:two-component system, NtrC family, response regulator AtoC